MDQAKRYKELEQENQRLRKVVADLTVYNSILCRRHPFGKGGTPGKPVSPAKRCRAVEVVMDNLQVSERRAYVVLGGTTQPRSTQRAVAKLDAASKRLTERLVALACQYGRYGYRRMTIMLRREGWRVNHKRVERLWRIEGLKVPPKQPKRRRLRFNDGSCVRLRPEYKNHVWSYDFVAERTSDGRPLRTQNIIDEYTRECLAIRVKRKITANDVIDTLTDLFITRGTPRFIRSDNGPEFTHFYITHE